VLADGAKPNPASAAGGSEDRGGCTSSLAGAELLVVAGVITKEKNVPVAQNPG